MTAWPRRWQGQGQVVGLVGEPGMGKTRLLTEFCRSLAGQPVTVYVGQCLSYGQATPYLPVRDILRQVCGLAEGDAAAVHTAAVQAAAPRQWHDRGGGRRPAAPAPGPPGGAGVPGTAQSRGAAGPDLCAPAAPGPARGAAQPLVLVVENLHWSDPTSEAWLASLVERLAGAAVLLGTYRPGYQPAWGAHAAVTQVALPPLRVPDSRTVVQAVLGAVVPPRGAAAGDGRAGGGESVLFGGVGLACRGTGPAGHPGGGARDGARGAGGAHGPVAPGGQTPAPDGAVVGSGWTCRSLPGPGRAARGDLHTGPGAPPGGRVPL